LLFASGLATCAAEWKDPSSHIVRFVEVEPGVRLEVLDWGGSGEPVILLAGHGDTGHIYDDFAPRLTDRFRVLALTRRGFGASTQPKQGYSLSRLVQDIAQVVKALHLGRVHLVGHSIAGDEMTRFALTFPEQTRKVAYLEAAYDRADAQRLESEFPKVSPYPPTSHDLRSPQAVCAFTARTEILMPESEIRATRVFGRDGRFLRPVTPNWILHDLAAIVEHPDYRSIHAPLLAIYAVYETPGQLAPRYSWADRETRTALDKIFEMWSHFAEAQRHLFRQSVPDARVVEIHGANHYVFISHREKVLGELRAFLHASS
jgi:non-heme chloroperoxidase